MTLILPHDTPAALGFDLAAAVSSFADQLEAHRFTVDVPAPTAHPLVEMIVKRHGGQFEIAPVPAPPVEPEPEPQEPSVPASITPRQCRLILLQQGLLSTVNAMIAQQDEAAQVAWEYANEFRRDDPLLNNLAASLGLSEAQIDQFFIAAAKL